MISRRMKVPKSVLEAIRLGLWDFEPEDVDDGGFDATPAMPGTGEKLDTLAERAAEGLPLWHPSDRRSYDDEFPVNALRG